MAPSIIYINAIRGEVFLPGQIFVFGGFALQANSLGHLEQIDSYAPGHQIGFGNLKYVAGTRGYLIFHGFETVAIAPPRSDQHDLNLSSDHIQEMVPVAATAFNPEQIAPSEATESTALEPHTDSTPCNTCVTGTPDSFSALSSEPCEPADAELDVYRSSNLAPKRDCRDSRVFQHQEIQSFCTPSEEGPGRAGWH